MSYVIKKTTEEGQAYLSLSNVPGKWSWRLDSMHATVFDSKKNADYVANLLVGIEQVPIYVISLINTHTMQYFVKKKIVGGPTYFVAVEDGISNPSYCCGGYTLHENINQATDFQSEEVAMFVARLLRNVFDNDEEEQEAVNFSVVAHKEVYI